MSFPAESQGVSLDSINSSDVLIEDRMIGAMKSTGTSGGGTVPPQESKAAGRTQFYSRLIDALAESIHTNDIDKKKDWNLEKLKTASVKILDIVTADDKIRRFIWKRQLPTQHYIHLSRVETVNKIANDLLCRIRKLDATADHNSKPPPTETCHQRKKYAHCLIVLVCNAYQAGELPNRAIFQLDRPPFTHQLSFTETKLTEDAPKQYDETPQERGLRLLLRQRLLACVRTDKPIIAFANALLAQWDLPPLDIATEGEPVAPSTKVIKTNPRRLKRPVPTSGSDEEDSKVQTTGVWRHTDRISFLQAFEMYPIGQWTKMATLIPNRNLMQISRFGRYLKKKFNLSQGEFPNSKVREYLLRPDDR